MTDFDRAAALAGRAASGTLTTEDRVRAILIEADFEGRTPVWIATEIRAIGDVDEAKAVLKRAARAIYGADEGMARKVRLTLDLL